MSRKDLFHEEFKEALIADGWEITDDPLVITFKDDRKVKIDLGAERILGAQKDNEQIAVEIKTFLSQSFVNELHRAVGQFINYRIAIKLKDPGRVLFLAIPEPTWQADFQYDFFRLLINEAKINIVTYDPSDKSIVQWIKYER
ncbi:MAG: element excision factor XisH family protein [Bacteroidota bacterium]